MKVETLLKMLSSCNPSDTVLIATDPEGNNYRGVDEVSEARRPSPDDDPMLREVEPGHDEDEVCRHGDDVVVIWPT